eukprot:g4602.t1
MASLQYFGFVLTTATYIDSWVHEAFEGVYSFGKKRAPSTFDSVLEYVEHCVRAIYEPVHKWLSTNAFLCLEVADSRVGKGIAKVECAIPHQATQHLTNIREVCKSTAATISEYWKRHGVVLGTLVLLYAVLIAIISSVFTSAPCQAVYKSIQNSEAMVKTKTCYQNKIQPCLKKIGEIGYQSTYNAMNKAAVSFEVTKDKIDPIITSFVASHYYKKAFHYISETKGKVASTKICKNVVKFVDPYIGFTLDKLWKSELYVSLVQKFTPVKDE